MLFPAICNAANAQQTDSAVEIEGGDAGTIIVTARRRAERLDATPLAVTGFDEADMEARSAVNVADIVNFVPNAMFDPTAPISGSSNSASVFIRGIGQSDFVFTVDPGVAVYLDDVYLARSTGSAMDMLDVERVEVLRGPQGTLFGRNTIGGAVRVITNAPRLRAVEGRAEAVIGSFDRIGITGVANAPVGANAALRLAASYRREDGYGRRLIDGRGLGGQEAFQARGSLLWRPSDRLSLRLSADHAERDDQSPVSTSVSIDPPSIGAPQTLFAGLLYNNLIEGPGGLAPCERPEFAFPFCGFPGLLQLPTLPAGTLPFDSRWITGDLFQSLGAGPTGSTFSGTGLTATVDYEAPVSIRWISAYRRFRAGFGRDPDNSPLVLIDTANQLEHEQLSLELQLSRVRPGLAWVGGLYYFQEDGFDRVTAPFVEETFAIINRLGLGCSLLPGLTGLPEPLFVSPCPNIFRIDFAGDGTRVDNRSISAFGEATIDLTDWLSVTAGLRWTRDRKQVDISGFLVGGLPVAPEPVARRRFKRLTPRIIVEAAPAADTIVYASWSTGFKSGGFNQRYGAPVAAPTSFAPESVRTFELGLRTRLPAFGPGGGPRLAVIGFWSDYEDIQAIVFDGGIPRTINAAAGRSRGVEVEASWTPVRRLTLAASYGWLDTRYTRLDPAIIGTFGAPIVNPLRLDNRFADSPRHSFALSAEYAQPLSRHLAMRLRGDLSHRSSFANDAVNTPELVQGPVTLVNARLTLQTPDERWSASLFGTNLLDERYLISGVADPAGFGVAEANAAHPRRWGAALAFRW